MREDVFVSVDIEADGPIPGDYSMISLGAAVVGSEGLTFYREIKPISSKFVPEALAVSGLAREKLLAEGREPEAAMREFAGWLLKVCPTGRPVFVAFNATFDWMFVNWYFVHFVGVNPFGISGLDIKAYYMGALGLPRWSDTSKRRFDKRFLTTSPHTHHALDDAREQAEIFLRLKTFAQAHAERHTEARDSGAGADEDQTGQFNRF
jgi:DNA polymerase III epsilon subunit-like protein